MRRCRVASGSPIPFPVSEPYNQVPSSTCRNTPCSGRFVCPYTGKPDRCGIPRRCLRLQASADNTARSHHTEIPTLTGSFRSGAYAARRESLQSLSTLLDFSPKINNISFLLFRHLQKEILLGQRLQHFFTGGPGELFVRAQQQIHGVNRLPEDRTQSLREIIPNLATANIDVGIAFFTAAKHRYKFTVFHCTRSSSISGMTGANISLRQPSKNGLPAMVPSSITPSRRFLGASNSMGISVSSATFLKQRLTFLNSACRSRVSGLGMGFRSVWSASLAPRTSSSRCSP